jgi:hypothetical protein
LQAFVHAFLKTSVNAVDEMTVAKAQPQKLFPRFCPAVHFVRAVTSASDTFRKCQFQGGMSVYQAKPEVVGGRPNRRD